MSDLPASASEEARFRGELAEREEQIVVSIQNALGVPGAGLAHMEYQDGLQTRANHIRRRLGLEEQPGGNPPASPRRWHWWILGLSLGFAVVAVLSILFS